MVSPVSPSSQQATKHALEEESFPLTSKWLSATPAPPLFNASEQVAERLVLLVHYGMDFTIWGGSRRAGYWDALMERVKAATYAGNTLTDWWETVTRLMGSAPRNREERRETLTLLAAAPDREVLTVLRNHATAITLRVRLAAESYRDAAKEAHLESGGDS